MKSFCGNISNPAILSVPSDTRSAGQRKIREAVTDDLLKLQVPAGRLEIAEFGG